MAIKNILPSLLLFFLNASYMVAQKNNALNATTVQQQSTAETIYMHVNASTFVTGEKLFYKLYCLNANDNSISKVSKVAYVELVSTDKKIVFSHKLFLENATGQSDFYFPSTVSSGNYKLIGYTKWMQNNSKNNFFEQEITIINPFETTLENADVVSATNINQSTLEGNATIALNKMQFQTREKVTLKINSLSEKINNGRYSVSVHKIENLPENVKKTAVIFAASNKELPIILTETTVLPELRGELLYGKISSNTGSKKIGNISVALSITGNPFVFKIVQTNSKGEFIFNIDSAYENSEIIIQVMDTKEKDYTITLHDSASIDYNSIAFTAKNKLEKSAATDIQNRSVANQIQTAYESFKTDSITKLHHKQNFYEPLGKEYILDDYTRFTTLKETITEVVSEMNYVKKEGKYYFYLKDYFAKSQLSEPSLVLFDGLLVQDASELINFKSVNIEKIAIIPTGYIYGGKVFNGLISIFSKKESEEKPLFTDTTWLKAKINIPELSKKYYHQEYLEATKYNRIPDDRHQLLWEPNVTSNELSFYTSDIIGTFEIVVEGFSDDGKPLTARNTFEVK